MNSRVINVRASSMFLVNGVRSRSGNQVAGNVNLFKPDKCWVYYDCKASKTGSVLAFSL